MSSADIILVLFARGEDRVLRVLLIPPPVHTDRAEWVLPTGSPASGDAPSLALVGRYATDGHGPAGSTAYAAMLTNTNATREWVPVPLAFTERGLSTRDTTILIDAMRTLRRAIEGA